MRFIAVITLLMSVLALGATLPTCYYTYDQISDMLADYEAQYPTLAKRVLIGHSQQDNLPIYALRITRNVDQEEYKPALLFIGQVHAEELLGVQITMSNIAEILANNQQLPYRMWLFRLDIWFIPTLNPEGHNVVTSNLDTSYRKNKRDNNNNGIFDFDPRVGYDIDGVDINRNMSFNWVHGDTLYAPTTTSTPELFDYYRGPAPMSESEVQALDNLCEERRFIYSIVWHSSRTGNLSEKCYYPFNWKQVRPSPDLSFSASIGEGLAATIVKENGSGSYEPSPNLSRKGATHDWMYQQFGTFQTLIECGTSNLQPDSTLMVNTVQRCSNATRWLLNRAMDSSSLPSNSMLTGIVTDAATGEGLQAEIIIEEHHAPWFRPRLSYENGRFYRPLATGRYTLRVRKQGYFDEVMTVGVNNSSWSERNVQLTPRQPAIMSGRVFDGEQDIPALMVIGDVYVDSLSVSGNYVYESFEGEYPVTIHAEGYYPYIGTVVLSPGTNNYNFQLSPINLIFEEDWENGLSGWDINGPWVLQEEQSASGHAITDSWGGNGFYAQNCDVWIQTQNPINLPMGGSCMLSFDSHLYTEYEYDPVRVQISADGEEWTTLWTDSGRQDWWQRIYVDLSEYSGDYYLRFRLTDQSNHVELTDPGWTIDNIRIFSGSAVSNDDNISPQIGSFALYPNSPNPFNPSTTISFANDRPASVKLEIFNIKGQKVRTLVDETLSAGTHRVVWDGTDELGRSVSSGLYMYRLSAPDFVKTLKMMMLK